MQKTYSIHQINTHLQRIIRGAFSKDIWVDARISNPKISRGHTYLTLLDTEDNGFQTAKASAVIWAQDRIKFNSVHGKTNVDNLISDDVGARVLINVSYHISYGLSFHIKDIDPAHTLGKLEIKHQEILNILTKERRLDKNNQIPLPSVIQNIAVISAKTAAGFIDLANHLRNNPYGYKYHITIYESSMQGVNTEKDVSQALKTIEKNSDKYDAVVIVRGGGSKIDLASFDSLVLGRMISDINLPVFSGIGHDIDMTIVDRVAHSFMKTPTAVSESINQHNRFFEEKLLFTHQQIQAVISEKVKNNEVFLNQFTALLYSNIKNRFKVEYSSLERIHQNMKIHAINHIDKKSSEIVRIKDNIARFQALSIAKKENNLKHIQQLLRHYDPENILKLGYSITRQNNKAIRDADSIDPSLPVTTTLYKGKITTHVREK